MKNAFFQFLAHNIWAHLVGKPLFRCFDSIIVINTKDQALKEDFFLQFLGIIVEFSSTDPLILCCFLFISINRVIIFIVQNISPFFVEMLKPYVHYFIDVKTFWNLFRELKLSTNSDDHFCSNVLVNKLFNSRLSVYVRTWNLKDYIGLSLFL